MRLSLMIMFLISLFCALPAHAAERTIIVLDASGSMWGQINGRSKMEIARETLGTVLKSVPRDNEIGLMVYGHREKGSCGDIELAVAPKANSAEEITAFANGVNPKGKTPISQAVRQAAEALKFTEEKATVVLVTDGLETCEADPCAIATELEKQGVDFTAHVVGFGLTKEEGKQVACLAENTGGVYLQASDAAQLAEALVATVAVAAPKPVEVKPEPKVEVPVEQTEAEFNVEVDTVMMEGGPSLGDSQDVRWDFFKANPDGTRAGDSLEGNYNATLKVKLPVGKYVGVVRLGNLIREIPFEVKAGEVARPYMNMDAATLTLQIKRTADQEAPESEGRIDVSQGTFSDGNYGRVKFYVPAGEIAIIGKLGPATVEEKVSVKAGEVKEQTLIVASGIVVTAADYAEGGPAVEGGDMRFDVVSAKKQLDGTRKEIIGNYGIGIKLDVPAGDYVLIGKLGQAIGETPFTVKAGELVDVKVNINGGVIVIKAPGGHRIDILSAKKDIQGNRKDISGNYGEEYQDTVPAGDYVIRVGYNDVKPAKEMPAVVKAGERTEITVE